MRVIFDTHKTGLGFLGLGFNHLLVIKVITLQETDIIYPHLEWKTTGLIPDEVLGRGLTGLYSCSLN